MKCVKIKAVKEHMHEGHRKRMLERLIKGGEDLQDHEILEILLFNAVPRKDTNGLAHTLISSFGGLENVFRADFGELKLVPDVGDEIARYIRAIGLLLNRISFNTRKPPSLNSVEKFYAFLNEQFALLEDEVVEFYCLDPALRVQFTQRFTSYSPEKAEITVEDVSRLIVAKRPAGLVAAHNHPQAPARPSRDDDDFTLRLKVICSMNGVKLYDHFIVGTNGIYSYNLEGRLDNLTAGIQIDDVLGRKRI